MSKDNLNNNNNNASPAVICMHCPHCNDFLHWMPIQSSSITCCQQCDNYILTLLGMGIVLDANICKTGAKEEFKQHIMSCVDQLLNQIRTAIEQQAEHDYETHVETVTKLNELAQKCERWKETKEMDKTIKNIKAMNLEEFNRRFLKDFPRPDVEGRE